MLLDLVLGERAHELVSSICEVSKCGDSHEDSEFKPGEVSSKVFRNAGGFAHRLWRLVEALEELSDMFEALSGLLGTSSTELE